MATETRKYQVFYRQEPEAGVVVWVEADEYDVSKRELAIEAFVATPRGQQVSSTNGIQFVAISLSDWIPVELEVVTPPPVVTFKPTRTVKRATRAKATAAAPGGGDA